MKKYMKFSIYKMITNIVPSCIAALIMFVTGYFFRQINSSYIWQIISIIVCVLVYGCSTFVIFKKQVIKDFEVFKTNWHIN